MKEKRIVDYLWVGLLMILFFVLFIEQWVLEIDILPTKFYFVCIIPIMVVIFFKIDDLKNKIKKLGDKD